MNRNTHQDLTQQMTGLHRTEVFELSARHERDNDEDDDDEEEEEGDEEEDEGSGEGRGAEGRVWR